MKDIKAILMDEIDLLRSGKVDYKRANIVAKLSAQYIYKERISIEKESLADKIKARTGK